MIFEWDPAKAVRNVTKHRLSFEEASTVFRDPGAMTYPDPDHSDLEAREITIGRSYRNRIVLVAHCERLGRTRIISARKATKRERRQYEEKPDERAT